MAEYMASTTATQRETIIQAAKFPKKIIVASYAEAKRAMRDFLISNPRPLSYFDERISLLERRARREPEGWKRDQLRRNIDAVEAFRRTLRRRRIGRYNFESAPASLRVVLEGVRINVQIDVLLTETDAQGVQYSGGCVLFVARASRNNIEARRKSVAAIVHWSLESANPNLEVLPRLCLSFDVFDEFIGRAPTATERIRRQIRSACGEVASRWDTVGPPPGYDGPSWR